MVRCRRSQHIVRKIEAIKNYISNPDHDPLISLESIFQEDQKAVKKVRKIFGALDPLTSMIKKRF